MSTNPLVYQSVSSDPKKNCWICLEELQTDVVAHEGQSQLGHPLHRRCFRKLVRGPDPRCGLCRKSIKIALSTIVTPAPIPRIVLPPRVIVIPSTPETGPAVTTVSLSLGNALRSAPCANLMLGSGIGALVSTGIILSQRFVHSAVSNVLGLISQSFGEELGSTLGRWTAVVVSTASAGTLFAAFVGTAALVMIANMYVGMGREVGNLLSRQPPELPDHRVTRGFARESGQIHLGVLGGIATMAMYSSLNSH